MTGAFDLTGRTPVVTGATRGIGFSLAVAPAEAGACIFGASACLDQVAVSISDAVPATV